MTTPAPAVTVPVVNTCSTSRRRLATGAALLCVALATGCITETTTTPVPRNTAPRTTSPGPRTTTDGPPPELNLTPGGRTLTLDVRAVIGLLGVVPYDNFALPIISPDGTRLATQTGVSPTWSTTLARSSATVPEATRIEVHRLDLGVYADESTRARPVRELTLAEPVLLGRSCTRRGFLVESPRADGSRWIGLASWTDGSIEWLVRDENVNAFATLGPDGRLAWSRRAPEAEHFDLVVRRGGAEFIITGGEQDWLFPTYSNVGDGLFVMSLRAGLLDLAFVNASGAAAFRQSIVTTALAKNASDRIAYNTMAGHVGTADVFTTRIDQLGFVHPSFARAAVWRPLAAGMVAPTLLYEKSFHVLPDDSTIAFVSTPTDLMRQDVIDPHVNAKLLAGVQIPRRVDSADWHCVLLAPQRGSISLTALRLLPPER